jgi:aspartate racemase
MDFEARVHALSQQLIPGHGNTGYPPMVVYYHRRPPVVMTDAGVPVQPYQVDPSLLDAARRLGTWADFLVIVTNSVHLWHKEIAEAADRPVLNMIDLTLEEVCRRGWRTVGLLTYVEPSVYRTPLEQRGITCELLPDELQRPINVAIPALSAGAAGTAERDAVRAGVDALRGRGVDGIILGCTELPLLLGADAVAPDLIDPVHYLVDAAVRFAIA